MAFERREVKTQETENILWKILKWYWILIPALYFLFVTPPLLEEGATGSVDDSIYFVLAFLLLNVGMAGILISTPPKETTRDGAAENILKIAVVQQLIAQNTIGALLALGAWYKLPKKSVVKATKKEESESKHLEPKTLYILISVLLIATIGLTVAQYLMVS